MPALQPQARTILKTRFVNHGVKEVFSLLIVHGFDNSSHLVAFLWFFFGFGDPGQRFLVCCLPYSRQSFFMWPCFWHLKHCPSFLSLSFLADHFWLLGFPVEAASISIGTTSL